MPDSVSGQKMQKGAMNSDMRIMFPMSINASGLFDEIHKTAAIWRQQLDNRNPNRALLKVREPDPGPPTVDHLQSTMRRGVNLIA